MQTFLIYLDVTDSAKRTPHDAGNQKRRTPQPKNRKHVSSLCHSWSQDCQYHASPSAQVFALWGLRNCSKLLTCSGLSGANFWPKVPARSQCRPVAGLY